MNLFNGPLWTVIIAATAILLWFWLRTRSIARRQKEAEEKAREAIREVQLEAENLKKERLLEAKDQLLVWRSEAEAEIHQKRREVDSLERVINRNRDRLHRREKDVMRREKSLRSQADHLRSREAKIDETEGRIQELLEQHLQRLEAVAGMTREEAKKTLLRQMEDDARHDAAVLAKQIEEECREKAEQEARKVIVQAIQRCAAEHVVETSVSVVDLPSDDMKGRIIGREGRNIRALEQATGVDLIVDDTPEAVILSCFDPLRREVARIAIEKLIRDGRIHPARIEEIVEKVQQDMEKQLLDEGKQTALDLGIHDMHPELLRMLGRLRYRTSYGQNVLNHSREVATLAGLLAQELGVNHRVCIRAGLIHDIGKAVDREMEGTHLQLGVDLATKFKESPEVIHAVEAHHFDVPFNSVEAVLVQAADAISAARPGARREVLENYVKRLEKLEDIAGSFKGVSKAFALQAGREVRIIVESSKITDEEAFWLSKDVAKKIESELQYPGQIKVTVIREMRAVDYAK